MSYLKSQLIASQNPPQIAPLDERQVANSAGGYSYPVDDWTRLQRFLVLGTEGGSYYASEKDLTKQSFDAVKRAIVADGARAVEQIASVSESGRAPKQDPALFALALAFKVGSIETAKAAGEAFPCVVRIGTHMLHFADFADGLKGWSGPRGRVLRAAVSAWYNANPKQVAFQVTKYESRDKWSQRDVVRLARPKPSSGDHSAIFHWVVKGWESVGDEPHPNPNLAVIWAAETAKKIGAAVPKLSDSDKAAPQPTPLTGLGKLAPAKKKAAPVSEEAAAVRRIVGLIRDYDLQREHIPTQFLNSREVWEELLQKMPLTALVRNLATLTRVGLIEDKSSTTVEIADRITSTEALRRARVHPFQMLLAAKTYAAGKSLRGSNTWTANKQIVEALDAGFLASFGNVTPTGKRIMYGLDISGSMWGSDLCGVPRFHPAIGAGALAYVGARTEPNLGVMAFQTQFVPFPIKDGDSLQDVLAQSHKMQMYMGRTDCAVPMVYAAKHRLAVDAFVVLTDSETYAGVTHPMKALQDYRQQSGRAAKLIVVGMVSNGFTIADPKDAGTLDVVGMDASVPTLMADFIGGAL